MKTQTENTEVSQEIELRVDEMAMAGEISGQVAYYLKEGTWAVQ